MARQPRFFVEGEALHIIQRGNNRDPIFAVEEDYRFFLICLIEASHLNGVLIHAYVLMTNHVHLLATPRQKESLPKKGWSNRKSSLTLRLSDIRDHMV